MTTRKEIKRTPPAYVSGKRAAAELDLAPQTFLGWVKDGLLPGPEGGSPPSAPRWKWSRLERWLAGDRSDKPVPQAELFPPDSVSRHRKRGPKPGSRKARVVKTSEAEGARTVGVIPSQNHEIKSDFTTARGDAARPELIEKAQEAAHARTD